MKSKIPFQILILLLCQALSAQVKIGDNPQTINPASLLELESTQQVLVITRVTTEQMEAIVPSNGALVYNIDESCLAYYDGERWINLCEALRLSFTTDPIVNQDTTMIITEIGDQINFEVGRIRGGDDTGVFNNIVDFSITSQDIQNNAINAAKLAPNSVGNEEIEDNAVTAAEIDLVDVTLSDFINDVPFLEGGDLIAANVGFDPTSSGLAATNVQDAIDQLILGADFPYNTDFEVVGQQLVLTDFGGSLNVPLSEINNQDLVTDGTPGNIALSNGGNELNLNVADADADPGNEIQEITSTDNSVTIAQTGNDYDLSVPAGSDDQNLTGAVLDGTNLTISIEDGNPAVADLSSLATDAELAALNVEDADADPGNEIQDLNLTANILTITENADATLIDLTPYVNTDAQTAADVPIADAGDNFTSADVEGALEELISLNPGANLSNSDLVQTTNVTRTYDIDGGNLVFTGSGDFGIGNGANPPSNKLHVAGAIRAEGILNSSGTTPNEPSYRFSGDTNTGIYNPNPDQLALVVGAQPALLTQAAVDGAEIVSNGSLELTEQLIDETGNAGAEGDILVATTTGTAWQAPAIKAWAKATGSLLLPVSSGIDSVTKPAIKTYVFNLDTSLNLSADYVIQVSVEGNFDFWIENQTTDSFTIIVQDPFDPALDATPPAIHVTIIE